MRWVRVSTSLMGRGRAADIHETMSHPVPILPTMAIVLAVMLPVYIAVRMRVNRRERGGLNDTEDWTPGSGESVQAPMLTPLTPYDREFITKHLEPGERLEGFTRGFFVPARMKDWSQPVSSGVSKLSLLVAATSRRMLLFEMALLNVQSRCFVPYDAIESMQPPKKEMFGTSGQMRVVLRSGRTYQFRFIGPLLNPEGMELEQAMAEKFRRIADRIEASPSRASSSDRRAA